MRNWAVARSVWSALPVVLPAMLLAMLLALPLAAMLPLKSKHLLMLS